MPRTLYLVAEVLQVPFHKPPLVPGFPQGPFFGAHDIPRSYLVSWVHQEPLFGVWCPPRPLNYCLGPRGLLISLLRPPKAPSFGAQGPHVPLVGRRAPPELLIFATLPPYLVPRTPILVPKALQGHLGCRGRPTSFGWCPGPLTGAPRIPYFGPGALGHPSTK